MKDRKDSYMDDVGIIKKLDDIPELRRTLINEFDLKSYDHKLISRYGVFLARHVLEISGIRRDEITRRCIEVNELWQRGEIRFQVARDAADDALKAAAAEKDSVRAKALRVLAQVAATPHVKRHALIASDYAVKMINVMYPGDYERVRAERETQINLMRSVL